MLSSWLFECLFCFITQFWINAVIPASIDISSQCLGCCEAGKKVLQHFSSWMRIYSLALKNYLWAKSWHLGAKHMCKYSKLVLKTDGLGRILLLGLVHLFFLSYWLIKKKKKKKTQTTDQPKELNVNFFCRICLSSSQ